MKIKKLNFLFIVFGFLISSLQTWCISEKNEKSIANPNRIKSTQMTWIEIGPDNFGGRTRALLIDKDNHNIVYAGAVNGGLWRSVTGGNSWNKITYSGNSFSQWQNMCITSICQASNGDIYFGTGEIFKGCPNYSKGNGIWKSTKANDTEHNNFVKLISTDNNSFEYVSRIAADPTNPSKIFVSTSKGLMISDDAGLSWTLANGTPTFLSTDVKTGTNGLVISEINSKTYISHDNGLTFHCDSIHSPFISEGRLEFAISPSDPNYIYCQSSKPDGNLFNIFQSNDNGDSWHIIGPGVGSNGENNDFNPLGSSGMSCNAIEVFPNDPQKIIVGGANAMWIWSADLGWEKIASSSETGSFYIPDYQHIIVFHPDFYSNQSVYIGTDSGIFFSSDNAYSFSDMNKNYNTVQFNSVCMDGEGHIAGGSDHNGSLYFDYAGNNLQDAILIKKGDGGFCEMSVLDPQAIFVSSANGLLKRSQEKGQNFDDESNPVGKFFYSNRILNKYWEGLTSNIGTFDSVVAKKTPFRLWESFNDEKSIDSVKFKNVIPDMMLSDWEIFFEDFNHLHSNFTFDTMMIQNSSGDYIVSTQITYQTGETIFAISKTGNRKLPFVLTEPLLPDDSVAVKDIYQSVLAMGFNGNIWITRKPLDFTLAANKIPWFPIIKHGMNIGMIEYLEFSKDGNYLYFASENHLYRVSNILDARTDTAMTASFTDNSSDINLEQAITVELIYTFNHNIKSIAVDPNEPENVLITLGDYGFNDYLMYSNEAATSQYPEFQSKQGNLPVMQVFSSIIGWNDSKRVITGTEYGVYMTEDITVASPEWQDQNINGMQNVPVMMLRQQLFPNAYTNNVYNHGVIYAATYGRGIFKSETFEGPAAIDENSLHPEKSSLIVFPSPANDVAHLQIYLPKRSDVILTLTDISGKTISSMYFSNCVQGLQKFDIDIKNYAKGVYIANIKTSFFSESAKLIIQ